jgi:hypothetical protein
VLVRTVSEAGIQQALGQLEAWFTKSQAEVQDAGTLVRLEAPRNQVEVQKPRNQVGVEESRNQVGVEAFRNQVRVEAVGSQVVLELIWFEYQA